MLKSSLKFIGKSAILFTILMLILFATQHYFLNKIIYEIMKFQGRTHLEGEAKSKEVWNIVFGIIIPFVFIISTIIIFSTQHVKNKKV